MYKYNNNDKNYNEYFIVNSEAIFLNTYVLFDVTLNLV